MPSTTATNYYYGLLLLLLLLLLRLLLLVLPVLLLRPVLGVSNDFFVSAFSQGPPRAARRPRRTARWRSAEGREFSELLYC